MPMNRTDFFAEHAQEIVRKLDDIDGLITLEDADVITNDVASRYGVMLIDD